jgi:hypothetical protein
MPPWSPGSRSFPSRISSCWIPNTTMSIDQYSRNLSLRKTLLSYVSLVLLFLLPAIWLYSTVYSSSDSSRWPYYAEDEEEDSLFKLETVVDRIDVGSKTVQAQVRQLTALYAYMPPDTDVCIENVNVHGNLIDLQSTLCARNPKFNQETQSGARIAAKFYDFTNQNAVSTVRYESDTYLYPYDIVDITVTTQLLGYYKMDNQESVNDIFPISSKWVFYFPNWELVNARTERDRDSSVLFLRLQRPYIYRVMTPLLIFSLAIFTLIIPLIKRIPELAQVSTGLLFGMWGVRQIVVLPEIESSTILDPIFVALYTMFLVAIVVRLGIQPMIELALKKSWHNVPRTVQSLPSSLVLYKDKLPSLADQGSNSVEGDLEFLQELLNQKLGD